MLRDGPGVGLTRIPGLRWLHRATRYVARLVPTSAVVVDVGGSRFVIDPRDESQSALLRGESYEPEETALFVSALSVGDVVVDVGANVGYYSVLAAREVGATGRVYAFEPNPESRRLLLRNIEGNQLANVTVLDAALGATSGRTQLYVQERFSALASFSDVNARKTRRSVDVEVVTLDDFVRREGIGRIDVLKVDVQGAEDLVIRGALGALASFRPTVFMEIWPIGLTNVGSNLAELLERLAALGYSFTRVDTNELVSRDEVVALCQETGGTDLVLRPTGVSSSAAP